MGGVAFRGGTSCPVRSRPPRRYSTIHGLIDAPRFNSPLKPKKPPCWEVSLVSWRWGELNPRPVVQIRSVYRFIGARWLSGPGGSAESVGSVSEKMSLPPFRPGGKQAPVGVGRSGCFGAASSGFRALLLTQRERNCRCFRQL